MGNTEINIVPKFIDNALSAPAQSIGNSLSNFWELCIGNHINLSVKKQEFKHQENLIKFKKSIEDKTQNIPEENLVEPKLHVVGPAIEASKYYIDSEELREMFSNLISASIDNRKSNLVHPSFVELIKQLSPLDAQNLKLFKGVFQFPICEYRGVTKEDKAYITRYTNVFLQNPEVSDHNLISSSMSNLNRLGLIYISYSNFISDETFYDKFKNTSIYKKLKHEIERNGDESLEIQKGLTKPTPIGKDFIKICLS